MEQVLNIYEKEYDPKKPVICFDERPCQLIDNIIVPTAPSVGKERREDYHYKRNGTCVVLLAVEPLTGKRIVEVRERKTKKDYTAFLKIVEAKYENAEKITIIQDNLNTHNPSSFYENMDPQSAFELTGRFELVYTPKKASWLNMAEIEFSALSKQCLDRRIGKIQTLRNEVNTWTKKRNKNRTKIHWQFTKDRAREKFTRHYDDIKSN